MKKVLTIMLGMIMVFALAGCGGSGEKNAGNADDPQMTVYIEIDYPDASGVKDVDDFKLQVAEGSSVLQVLQAYAEANGCEVVMSDDSATAYVTSIGGVAVTDAAGWVYEVNDEMVLEAADVYILKDGDEASWEFTTWGE